MDHIFNILASYPLQVVSIEQITNHVWKISDGTYTYALKESSLTDSSVSDWREVCHQAYQFQFHELLPVYRTIDGALTNQYDHIYYYLTPWISADNIEKKQQIRRLYDSLGSIHAKTKQTIHMDVEWTAKQFRQYQTQLNDHQKFLSECMALFEKSHFMAPVELLFCTHYREIDALLQVLDDQIERFIDAVQENAEWNYSLCHNRLDFSHCLMNDHTYIINWEDACFHNPVHDLSALYRKTVMDYDTPVDSFLQNFSIYKEQNSLTEAEMFLLAIYLLDPTAYMNLTIQYRKDPEQNSQVELIQYLQQEYRRLSFAMRWVHFTGNEKMDSTED